MKLYQKHAVFYILYKAYKNDRNEYISPSKVDVGDVYIPELNKYIFTTWKTPARLSEIIKDNPNLIDRILVQSKAGTWYYKYKIRNGVTKDDIKDEDLLAFYQKLKQ